MERAKRSVDTALLMEQYRALLETVDVLPLKVSGSSMTPFLAPGRDSVLLAKPGETLRRGDIAFYQRPNGQYILHRVCRAEGESLWFVGDAQDVVEGPLPQSCVFAYVTAARRKDRVQKPGVFWWDFFAGPWLRLIGRRQRILKLYGKLK